MKRTQIFLLVVLLVSTAFFSACNSGSGSNTASANADSADVQIVHVSVVGGTYVFSPTVVKKDIPVKLVFDTNTVVGCARSVVIPTFGVRGYVDENNNAITFTPTQTGTFNMACSMNMYRGSFTVE